MARKLDDKERLAWLRLARTENVGPVTFASLIARFGGAGAAIQELPRLAARGGSSKNFVLPPEEDVAREIEDMARLGGQLIAACEPGFPPGLFALDLPPPVIAVLGQAALLQREMVAVVGAQRLGFGPEIRLHPGAGSDTGRIGGRIGPGARNRHGGA